MHLPYLSDEDAKAKADAILGPRGYLKRGKLPIPIETLAYNLGYPVSAIPGLEIRFEVLGTGYLNASTGKYEILIDSEHYERQLRSSPFTIAEELGHFILHMPFIQGIKTPEQRVAFEEALSESTRRIFEKQAKMLASALLLPHDLFRPLVIKWVDDNAKMLRDDNPVDEGELINLIASKIGPNLSLSQTVVGRALTRKLPTPLIHELKDRLGIQYLRDLPENRITKG